METVLRKEKVRWPQKPTLTSEHKEKHIISPREQQVHTADMSFAVLNSLLYKNLSVQLNIGYNTECVSEVSRPHVCMVAR